MTKLLYDVCEWWYEGLRGSPEWVRIGVVALMFVGLWVVFTRPVLKEQRRKIRWLGYGVAVVDVVFMTYLSVWTWHFLGVPWATRALVPIKGQEPAEVVSWFVTSREDWFFEDARVFRYLEEVDPNWAKHEDAWRLLPGILRGAAEPETMYAPDVLAELKEKLGPEISAKLVAKFPTDWSRSRQASTVLRAERGKLAEKEKQAERLQLVALFGTDGRELTGDLIRAWVETKGDEALYPKTLAAVDAEWARSARAVGQLPWLKEELGDGDLSAALRSLEIVGLLGGEARGAIGAIIRLAVTTDADVASVNRGLTKIDGRWAESAEARGQADFLGEKSRSGNGNEAGRSLALLERIGPGARAALSDLVKRRVETAELAELNDQVLGRIDAAWARSVEATATVLWLAEQAGGGDAARAGRSLETLGRMGASARIVLGELIRLYVTTETNRRQLGATLAAIDARWAGSREAVGQREWLENEEREAWYTGDEAKRGRAEVVLRQVVGEWKPDRRAKDGKAYRLKLAAGVRVDLRWIAPGEYLQGSPASESGRSSDEGPQRRVKLTEGYWLGKTEVTQGDWEAVMGWNPSRFKLGRNYPVENVSWTEVMEYGRRVTERERAGGRLPAGYEYTLPSEAQWEYACRAGTTGAHAGDLNEMGWYRGNSRGKPHPVGEKAANAWGLHDMHGNVWEWCLDRYEGKYSGGSVTDPTGPASGSFRVLRGGSWRLDVAYCRSALRIRFSPGDRDDDLGFRLALRPSP